MGDTPFSIDLARLKARAQTTSGESSARIDQAAEKLGFDARAQKHRGRKPSPRTGQVHAEVMPGISGEIANEARRRGVQQGVLIGETWALYREKSGI